MTFTQRLYKETFESHREVDQHPFVEMIKRDERAGEMYVNFNKLCIDEIQKVLQLDDRGLYERLYRDTRGVMSLESNAMTELLEHCRKYPLESSYQFYLGILFGGGMLKGALPEHWEFLTYTDRKMLIVDFKSYLCKNVDDEDEFIKRVNNGYGLIKEVFDEFAVECGS